MPDKKHNPYQLAEDVAGWTLTGLALALVATVVVWSAIKAMGWWALALIPGIPAGIVIVACVAAALSAVRDAVSWRWRRRKLDWDRAHEGSDDA